MSEAEKKRRSKYRQKRKKWILIQIIALAVVSAIVLTMAFIYYRINKTRHIEYTERSDIDYLVQLSPNEFYEEEWLSKDRSYVSSLMDNILTRFTYTLDMSAYESVEYTYSYNVDATLLIKNKYTGIVIFDPVTEIIPQKTYTQKGSQNLEVKESVLVNFDEYNNRAIKFAEQFKQKDLACSLILTMHMNVEGSCQAVENNTNSYFTSLEIPLAVELSEPVITSSAANGESRSLACTSGMNAGVFLVLSLIFGILDLLGGVFFAFFIFKTRNHDIKYTNKVKRLVTNYRSFIQEITAPFATEGYQLIHIKTFAEMLEVRDTVGSPLLMYANQDGTATSFVIPTGTGLLYTFEIRVEDYNNIYGITPEVDDFDELDDEQTVETTSFGTKIKAFFASLVKLFTRKKTKDDAAEKSEIPEDDVTEESEIPEDDVTEKSEIPEDDVTEESETPEDDVTEESETPEDDVTEESETPKDDVTEESETPEDDTPV